MSTAESFVEVFSGSAIEASLVRGLLESSGFAAFLEGEHMGVTAPYLAAGGGAGAVKVIVNSDDAIEARKLIDEHHESG